MSNEIIDNSYNKYYAASVILLIIVFLIVFNRRQLPKLFPSKQQFEYSIDYQTRSNSWNTIQIDTALTLVKNGDIIVRAGKDDISDLFRRFNTHDASFSHAGIAFIENGYPFVYHISVDEINKDGIIKRDSLKTFISNQFNNAFGIYTLPLKKNEIDNLYLFSLSELKEKRKFDSKFDLNNDSTLYCTEFIYKGINKVQSNPSFFEKTYNKDLDFTYIAVDNILGAKNTKLVFRVRFKK